MAEHTKDIRCINSVKTIVLLHIRIKEIGEMPKSCFQTYYTISIKQTLVQFILLQLIYISKQIYPKPTCYIPF